MLSQDIEELTQELSRLKLRVAQLEAAAAAPQQQAAPLPPPPSLGGFRIGDRVIIKNKVKRPANWVGEWIPEAAQRAIVTHFYRDQVHFRTDNGVTTWRATNNLKLDEHHGATL